MFYFIREKNVFCSINHRKSFRWPVLLDGKAERFRNPNKRVFLKKGQQKCFVPVTKTFSWDKKTFGSFTILSFFWRIGTLFAVPNRPRPVFAGTKLVFPVLCWLLDHQRKSQLWIFPRNFICNLNSTKSIESSAKYLFEKKGKIKVFRLKK